jgi:hypothetical protein
MEPGRHMFCHWLHFRVCCLRIPIQRRAVQVFSHAYTHLSPPLQFLVFCWLGQVFRLAVRAHLGNVPAPRMISIWNSAGSNFQGLLKPRFFEPAPRMISIWNTGLFYSHRQPYSMCAPLYRTRARPDVTAGSFLPQNSSVISSIS